jgi:hypothetical protein
MVKVWAEKEMRNYVRLQSAGIPAPRPIILRNHVLVMEFLGRDGWCVDCCVAMVTLVSADKQALPPQRKRVASDCEESYDCRSHKPLLRRAAPRLKDADLSQDRSRQLYLQVCPLYRTVAPWLYVTFSLLFF